MNLPTLADIEAAAQTVYRSFAPTPQYRWALLSERLDWQPFYEPVGENPYLADFYRDITADDILQTAQQIFREGNRNTLNYFSSKSQKA